MVPSLLRGLLSRYSGGGDCGRAHRYPLSSAPTGRPAIAHHPSGARPISSDAIENTTSPQTNRVVQQDHEVADQHRKRDGAGVFVRHALQKPHPLVITGIRSLGEAKELKNHGGVLLFVDAPSEVRYERMRSRNRDAEVGLTLEQFQANEAQEWHQGETDADFNLRDIKAMADITIDNTLPVDQFVAIVYAALGLKQAGDS